MYIDEFGHAISKTVAVVRRNFAWYDELVRASAYEKTGYPSDLPYVDEQLLNARYYDAPHEHLEQDHVYRTSGTTSGNRKKILYSAADHALYVKHRRVIFERFISPGCRTGCADMGTGHAAASAIELFRDLGLTPLQIDFRLPVREHVRLLNEWQPDVLFTMPMILDNIILHGGYDFHPKKIVVVGDVATVTWKNKVAETFGIDRRDLMDLYGSIEVGSIAYECHACGLYHFDDHIIPEVIDAATYHRDPSLQGMGDIVVLTSRERSYFPALRFVTDDRIVGFGRTRCQGRSYFVYECLLGRVGPELKHGEKLSVYEISSAVHEFVPHARFEIYKEPTRLLIRVASPSFTPAAGEQIKARIRQRNECVDQMISSELVGPIEIEAAPVEQLSSKSMKQSIRRLS